MSMASQSSSAGAQQSRDRRIWLGMFGGALAWVAHLLISYVIAEFGCVAGLARHTLLEISGLAWALIALALATLAAAAAALWLAIRNLRQNRDGSPVLKTVRAEVAHMSVLTNCAFAFAIVFESIPIFYYLTHC